MSLVLPAPSAQAAIHRSFPSTNKIERECKIHKMIVSKSLFIYFYYLSKYIIYLFKRVSYAFTIILSPIERVLDSLISKHIRIMMMIIHVP